MRKSLLYFGAALGGFAVIMQFILMMQNRTADVLFTIWKFFSYFTILTNLLVAVYFVVLIVSPMTGPGRMLSRVSTTTAVAVYIVIVGVVYNVILRPLWSPQGMQMVVDELLHTVIPILFLVHWLAMDKTMISYRSAFLWIGYPLLYCIYIIIRGEIARDYPYPFVDVVQLGYAVSLKNGLLMLIFFYATSLLFIFISNRQAHLRKRR